MNNNINNIDNNNLPNTTLPHTNTSLQITGAAPTATPVSMPPANVVMPPLRVTSSMIMHDVTVKYIANQQVLPDEQTCAEEVTLNIQTEIAMQNSIRGKGNQLPAVKKLPNESIALLIAARSNIALVAEGDKSQQNKKQGMATERRYNLPIAVYQFYGWNEGVWELTNSPLGSFGALVEKYKPDATRNDKQEVYTLVKSRLRIVKKCVVPYYVPVNNGIVDVLNKKLMPFTPDIVFTAKIHTDLNLSAANPFIPIPEDGSVWDVDSWLDSLGSPSFVGSIKEVLQAACLPLAPRDKMCLFYSTDGNNGKGTLCQLIRNLLGEDATVNIPLNAFHKDFALTNLPGAMAIVTDENDVSSFSKAFGVLKAIITGDRVTINVKYQNPFDYFFHGLVLECVNDYPNGNDKTGSFERRLHILTFEHCFTGYQKRYIKDRMIYREDVLQYILKMVLIDMDYRDKFTETAETKAALKQYVITTNSVVAFLQEILPECKWDLLPATEFLYEAYKVWYRDITPSGRVIGRNDFQKSVREFVTNDPDASSEWEWTDSTRSQGYIDCSVEEPLLSEYGLLAFQDLYRSNYACPTKLKSKYSGLKRRTAVISAQGTGKGSTTDETQEQGA